MALQVYKQGAWTNYTAGTTELPNTPTLHFRDTVLAIDTGVATSSTIVLPRVAKDVHFGIDGADGTVIAGNAVLKWIPFGSSAADAKTPAHESSLNGFATPRTADDANEFGTVANPPESFKIRFTSLAGTATTLSLTIQVQF